MSLKKIPKINIPQGQTIPKQVISGKNKIVFSFEHLDFSNPITTVMECVIKE